MQLFPYITPRKKIDPYNFNMHFSRNEISRCQMTLVDAQAIFESLPHQYLSRLQDSCHCCVKHERTCQYFPHWVYGESFSTDIWHRKEKKKRRRSENWNPLKPQAINKCLNALKFQISLIMDFPFIIIPINYIYTLKI